MATRRGDGNGYSRLTDGDLNTYWKSNPYLTKPFTGEEDHPQWVTVDLGSKVEINAIRIAWAAPYATKYRVQYWTGERDPFDRAVRRHLANFPARLRRATARAERRRCGWLPG